MSLKLYEFAVIKQPKRTKDGEANGQGEIVVAVQTILAQDDAQANMLAARSIPEEHVKDLDRLTVVLRPF